MDRTRDIGWDKNPRALPARATAKICIAFGIIIALVSGVIVALAVFTDYLASTASGVPVWLVGLAFTLAGLAMIAGSLILLRRVALRDQVRARGGSPDSTS